MSFGGLTDDDDRATTDYTFRADVLDSDGEDVDACEEQAGGYGLGVDRYMWQVDDDPEVRPGTISTGCPAGDYTLRASISSAANVELAWASASFSVVSSEPPPSTDASLSALALSGVDFGVFNSEITQYTGSVANDVAGTTVTATTNDDGAGYVVKLDGAADPDGTVPLAVGENAVSVEVTAEDGQTTKTYTVTVTRAEAPLSSDAALSALALSGVDFGAFNSETTQYTASVANVVAETTVTATTNHDGAGYVVKLDGEADPDGTVSLAVGANAVAVAVTAEDEETTRIYTVTVTRADAPLSSDATLSALALSGVDFGVFNSDTIEYTASVANGVAETTVTATTNDDGAVTVVKLDGAADPDGTVPLAVGENAVSVEVTAEDRQTTQTYTVTVTRAAPALPALPVTVDFAAVSVMAGTENPVTLSFGGLTPDDDRSTTDYIFRADVLDAEDGDADACEGGGLGRDRYMYHVDEDPEVRTAATSVDCPPGIYTLTASIYSAGRAELASASADFAVLPPPTAIPVPGPGDLPVAEQGVDDATLSALSVSPGSIYLFDSEVEEYHVGLASTVTQVTVTATPSHSGATVVIDHADFDTDDDGHQVRVPDGLRTITITVNSEDTNNTKVYTLRVGRGVTGAYGWKAEDDFNGLTRDANHRPQGLWSNGTTIWTADNRNAKVLAYTLATRARDAAKDFDTPDAARPTGIWSNGVTMWVADYIEEKLYAYTLATKARDATKDFDTLQAAGNVYLLGIWSDGDTMWVADAGIFPFQFDKIYSYNMPPSANANLSGLTLSGATLSETFAPATTAYTATAYAASATVTATTEQDDATVAITPADTGAGTGHQVALTDNAVTRITVTVTAQDGAATKTYTVDVTRGTVTASNDATLSALTVSPVDIIGFASDVTSYHVGVDVSQVTVTPTANQANASISIDGTTVASGSGQVVTAAAGLNTVTITVTAQNGATDKTYTIYLGRGVAEEYGWKAADDFNGLANAGNNYPQGVWSNGTTTWVADYSDGKLYAYNSADKTRDADKDFTTLADAGNANPTGIWSDETTMWVADYDDDKIYAYALDTKARDATQDFGTLADRNTAGNHSPTGIWSDGTTMWVADLVDGKIYAYNKSDKARNPGKDFNTLGDAGNANPTGIWSDETTMWVGDGSDGTLYAYDLDTKARDADKDFTTLAAAGNANPTGIWSDETTMWVGDSENDKVYSYNMPAGTGADLSELTLSGVTLSPPFARGTTDYTATATVAVTTVTATPRNPAATVAITPVDSGTGAGHQVALTNDARTRITIIVTAQGGATKTYNVLVSRGNPPALSDDATLSALSISPGSIHSFDSDTTTYHVGVANSVDQVTVTATANNSNATIAWSPADADGSADHQVDLSVGLNTVTITVTSQDTNNTKEYTIHAGRGVTTDYGWKAVDDFNTLYAAGNTSPVGIWSYGDTMWVADEADNKIYAYNLATKGRVPGEDFDTLDAAGNNSPRGIWSDGDTMWVADEGDVKLYAYNLSNKARDGTKDVNTLNAAGNTFPWGIWSDGVTMWVVDSSHDKIFAYNLSDGERDEDQDFNSLDGTKDDSLVGIWSDGATMWVGDYQDDKLYAYDLATKARTPGRDFNDLDASGNTSQGGIWSDGATMWVAHIELADSKLYGKLDSYNMPPSSDATLSALSVSPGSIHGFDPDTTTYHVGVAHTVSQATATATANNANATIEIGSTTVASGAGHPVALDRGLNTVTVTVTAQDGVSTEEYILHLGRGVTTDYGWKAADDFNTLYAAGNRSLTAIWSDGVTMWVVDNDNNDIYAYDMETKERDETKDFGTLRDAGNFSPKGIWSDGETMWVADDAARKLYAYDMETKARVPGKDFSALRPFNRSPRGIWSDGVTMWVVDNGNYDIYAYDMDSKEWDEDKHFITLNDVGNTTPRGLWSDGATMWVANDIAIREKIFAYNMATKVNDASKDFNTLRAAGKTTPFGLWSDGATMWVASSTQGKIYSYNMPPSGDASLRSISIDGAELPRVTRGRTAYSHTVNRKARTVTVAAEAAHPEAQVAITPADSSGAAGHQVALNRDGETPTTVTITVTAENGASREHTVKVDFRPPDPAPSLRGLRLDYGAGVGTHEILIGPCSRFPESSDLPYCTGREPSINEFHVDAGTAGLVTVIARTTRESETVAFKTEYGSTLTANIPDEDPAAGGHQVKLGGRGTSLTIHVVVSNRDGLRKGYKIRVTRQISGDTRLGELILSHSGSGRLLEHDLRYGNRSPSNLDPAFNSFWDRVKERPQTARYRATLLLPAETASGTPDSAVLTVRARERHAGSSMRLYGDYFDRRPQRRVPGEPGLRVAAEHRQSPGRGGGRKWRPPYLRVGHRQAV